MTEDELNENARRLRVRREVAARAAALPEKARSVELFRKRRFDSLVGEKLANSILLVAPI